MEFKHTQIKEAYTRANGHILLATLFEIRGLLDYELREIKESADSDPNYAVKKTIRLAAHHKLVYLESYMILFSKAIHRNGEFGINLYEVNEEVTLRLFKEADIALDFFQLETEVLALDSDVSSIISTSNKKDTINEIDIKTEDSSELNLEKKECISDYELMYEKLKKKNLLSIDPYNRYSSLLGKYQKHQLNQENAKNFREMYQLIVKEQNGEITIDTLRKMINDEDRSSSKENSNIEKVITTKQLANYNALAILIKKQTVKNKTNESLFLTYLGNYKSQGRAEDIEKLKKLYPVLLEKYKNVEIIKYQKLADLILDKVDSKQTEEEKKFLSTLENCKKQFTDGRLNSLECSYNKLHEQADVHCEFLSEEQYDELLNLSNKLNQSKLSNPDSYESKFKSTFNKFNIEPTIGRVNNLIVLRSKILENDKLNLDKYEKLLKNFSTKKLRQTKSKEYQFKCQLDSYKKKPTPGKLNSIENNYNAIMRKNKNK